MLTAWNAGKGTGDAVTDPPRWISIREAARRAGLPYSTLNDWIKRGVWPVRVAELGPRRYRVNVAELESWLEGLQARDQ
jgi:excisionase family DNA binding protein